MRSQYKPHQITAGQLSILVLIPSPHSLTPPPPFTLRISFLCPSRLAPLCRSSPASCHSGSLMHSGAKVRAIIAFELGVLSLLLRTSPFVFFLPSFLPFLLPFFLHNFRPSSLHPDDMWQERNTRDPKRREPGNITGACM